MEALASKKCIPCTGATPTLSSVKIEELRKEVNPEWEVIDGKKLGRTFQFDNFVEGLAFVNKIGEIAEAEDHHPMLTLSYKRVVVEITTHVIGGLSENDFILAAKIDSISK